MDFNRTYTEHQRLLMEAARAPSEGFRLAHAAAASHLAEQIGRAHRAIGAAAAPAWETLAAPARDSLASPGRTATGYAS
ncbi:MAG TPA: hypothetical protein VI168_18335 [Croceibacterium sp.]